MAIDEQNKFGISLLASTNEGSTTAAGVIPAVPSSRHDLRYASEVTDAEWMLIEPMPSPVTYRLTGSGKPWPKNLEERRSPRTINHAVGLGGTLAHVHRAL